MFSSSSGSTSLLTVVILLSDETQEHSAEAIRTYFETEILAHCDCTNTPITICLRSGQVPMERLLPICTTNKTLFVVLGCETPTSLALRTNSVHPVVSFSRYTTTTTESSTVTIGEALASFCSLHCPQLATRIQEVKQSKQQKSLVYNAELQTNLYRSQIRRSYQDEKQITGEHVIVPTAVRRCGKVRDQWCTSTTNNNKSKNTMALITTDRQSGFDRQLAIVPYKGAVLNLCSQFWFNVVQDIIPNHCIAIPHPNVMIVKKCQPFPIEFVVRSYMTGSTSTSIWKNYQNGVRNYCGHTLPDGMTKNMKLPQNLLTPTTKEEDHDRPISLQDIVKERWMTQADLDVCHCAALAVFSRGQELASQRGLILVDTKYEFGRCCETGQILLIDEVHTPDSSRYWLASTAADRIAAGEEPENVDKEFLRLWFRDHCDPYKDETLPEAPCDLIVELSRRYIQLYEMITWTDFAFEAASVGEDVISKVIQEYLE